MQEAPAFCIQTYETPETMQDFTQHEVWIYIETLDCDGALKTPLARRMRLPSSVANLSFALQETNSDELA
jgi:hypothetical protein